MGSEMFIRDSCTSASSSMRAAAKGKGGRPAARARRQARTPVSYTHLTLPTSDLEEISVVAVSLKKTVVRRYMQCNV